MGDILIATECETRPEELSEEKCESFKKRLEYLCKEHERDNRYHRNHCKKHTKQEKVRTIQHGSWGAEAITN